MPNEQIEKKSWTSYFTKKVILMLSAVATVFTVIGGVWGFEAHYATNSRVDNVVVAQAEEVKDIEMKLAGAFENQQLKLDARYWQFMYEKLTSDILEIKRQMRRYPEDEFLKEDYRDLIERRNEVKRKLDKALQDIKVN